MKKFSEKQIQAEPLMILIEDLVDLNSLMRKKIRFYQSSMKKINKYIICHIKKCYSFDKFFKDFKEKEFNKKIDLSHEYIQKRMKVVLNHRETSIFGSKIGRRSKALKKSIGYNINNGIIDSKDSFNCIGELLEVEKDKIAKKYQREGSILEKKFGNDNNKKVKEQFSKALSPY
jgi:hypothetical protein